MLLVDSYVFNVKYLLQNPEANILKYIRHAASGLIHIHDQGLIHMDVKPSNILVSIRTKLPSHCLT